MSEKSLARRKRVDMLIINCEFFSDTEAWIKSACGFTFFRCIVSLFFRKYSTAKIVNRFLQQCCFLGLNHIIHSITFYIILQNRR